MMPLIRYAATHYSLRRLIDILRYAEIRDYAAAITLLRLRRR